MDDPHSSYHTIPISPKDELRMHHSKKINGKFLKQKSNVLLVHKNRTNHNIRTCFSCPSFLYLLSVHMPYIFSYFLLRYSSVSKNKSIFNY